MERTEQRTVRKDRTAERSECRRERRRDGAERRTKWTGRTERRTIFKNPAKSEATDASKQQWSVEETSLPYGRQQINNKLKKLKKKDYWDQKKDLGRSGNGRSRRNQHFNVLGSVLGDRLQCQVTRALNTATAMLEAMVDESITLPQTGPELSAIKQDDANLELTLPLHCSSPTPSSSSGQSHQTRPGKRMKDSNTELLEYLERADERFLQHSKDLNDALLQKLETDTSAFLGLMGHMVSVMEAQAQK
ncbi:uncharacterized protein LOC125906353 [Epinephelus fuscoguttatus]|uniref:uncharacterized protein LOC125906353 n=1 Tax=Epinephelus fuscoguttatus TaxID=293821 RepID=UPI0020D05F38|nr:uncharacterized protein LOC125906353 [Epinephelus fuscoguttatus]